MKRSRKEGKPAQVYSRSRRNKLGAAEKVEAVSCREIGKRSEAKDPARQKQGGQSFRFFCEIYFPKLFFLPWADFHLEAISRIEAAVLHGGLFAYAMPRGSGKSTLAETAALWAALYGHREFVYLVGSDEDAAESMLESIKSELEGNPILGEDFDKVTGPIRALEGISHRCMGQLSDGKRTLIGWKAGRLVLPTIEGSAASGAIITVAGLTGGLRGRKFKRPDGRTVRPSLVLLDDPQTDQSARSLSQCAAREAILAGAVLGLAGPGVKISGLMPCTVIAPGDVADRILDKTKHPEWNGARSGILSSLPKNGAAWEKYAEARKESLRKFGDLREATAFFVANREALEAGAEATWAPRFNPDEVSPVQHAMNLKLQDEDAFWSEYMNAPLARKGGAEDEGILSADQIAGLCNGFRRREAPIKVERLTAFVDVQQKALFWIVCGWAEDFTGYVLDYGAYPAPRRPYFGLKDIKRTLQHSAPGTGLEGAIRAGLEAVVAAQIAGEWEREDGTALRVGLCLIDANWGASTETVYQFCRASPQAGQLSPCHGRYVGAGSKPFREYDKRPGDKVGLNWRIPGSRGKRGGRAVLYDVNFWKTFLHTRLSTPRGDKGGLTLFGKKPEDHRLLADHLTAEYRVKTEGRGRVVDEWKLRPDTQENHWLDGLVGCAVAASVLGVSLGGAAANATAGGGPAPATGRFRPVAADVLARMGGRK